MFKFIILFTSVILLSGCQLFSNEETKTQDQVISTTILVEETSSETSIGATAAEVSQTTEEISQSNAEYQNVFGETVIGQDRYPNTALEDNIPIGDLRLAIDNYFQEIVPADEKNNNLKEINADDLKNLQSSLSNNSNLKELEATVDQIIMTLDGQQQYIARLVVPMTYPEAQAIKENNDILLLNEAHAQIGNRLVMIAYLNQQGDALIPHHLNTSTYSLFSQAQ